MKPSRRITLLAVVGAMVFSWSQQVESLPSDPEMEAVLEATMRQQLRVWLDTTARASGTVVCLAIDLGGAPQSVDKEYLDRFRTEPAVRRAAECEARPKGAVERGTLGPAIMITAGPVEWIAEDEAWVTVTHFRTRMESGIRTYRVVREEGGWVSLGQIIKGLPN